MRGGMRRAWPGSLTISPASGEDSREAGWEDAGPCMAREPMHYPRYGSVLNVTTLV